MFLALAVIFNVMINIKINANSHGSQEGLTISYPSAQLAPTLIEQFLGDGHDFGPGDYFQCHDQHQH